MKSRTLVGRHIAAKNRRDRAMRIRRLLSIVLLGTSLALLVGSPIQAEPPPPTPETPAKSPDEYPFDPAGVVSQSAASLAPTPIGDEIEIAVTSAYEKDPAVALCAYDQYLVVYIIDGDVYGQRLTSGGDLLGDPFVIYDGTHYAAEPDVACEWSHNRFIVVWTIDYNNQGTDYDVYAQGVHGGHQTSGPQLHGSLLVVSQDGVVERDPAIACNSNDFTCLVVFEYSGSGNGDIYGQRVYIETWDISKDGDRFNISGFGAEEYNPDVSWGGYDDNYMVVWQYLYDPPEGEDYYRIVFNHVWDTEQGPDDADELRYPLGMWLIDVGGFFDYHQITPAVAYNRDERLYLTVFGYDYWGDPTIDYDIYAQRIDGGGAFGVGDPFGVIWTGYQESSPIVAFSGGPESFPGGMGANQFLVTYVTDEDVAGYVLYSQAVKGAYASSGGQLEGGPEEIDRIPAAFMWDLSNPDVIGSINNGWYLVVWEYHMHGISPDYDILGRMVSPYKMVYLPLVLRNFP